MLRRLGPLLLAAPAIALALGAASAAAQSPPGPAADGSATITTELHPGWRPDRLVRPRHPRRGPLRGDPGAPARLGARRARRPLRARPNAATAHPPAACGCSLPVWASGCGSAATSRSHGPGPPRLRVCCSSCSGASISRPGPAVRAASRTPSPVSALRSTPCTAGTPGRSATRATCGAWRVQRAWWMRSPPETGCGSPSPHRFAGGNRARALRRWCSSGTWTETRRPPSARSSATSAPASPSASGTSMAPNSRPTSTPTWRRCALPIWS